MEGADETLVGEVRLSGIIAWIGFSICLFVFLVLFWGLGDVRSGGGPGLGEGIFLFLWIGYFPALVLGAPAIGYMSLKGYTVAKKCGFGRRLELFCITPAILILVIVLIIHSLLFLFGDVLGNGLLVGGWFAMAAVFGLIGYFAAEARLREVLKEQSTQPVK